MITVNTRVSRYTGKELTGYRDVIRDAIYEDVKIFTAT